MRVVFLLSLLVSLTSAFTTGPQPWGVRMASSSSQRHMFSAEEEAASKTKEAAPALDVVEASALPVEDAPEGPKSVYKNMNTGEIVEVGWVDNAAGANINPLVMEWWAYPLVFLPVLLLADDAFHFLPTEGPLAFLKNL